MFAPKGTPDATIKKLTRDFKAVLADPDVRRKLGEAGFEIVASDGPALDACEGRIRTLECLHQDQQHQPRKLTRRRSGGPPQCQASTETT